MDHVLIVWTGRMLGKHSRCQASEIKPTGNVGMVWRGVLGKRRVNHRHKSTLHQGSRHRKSKRDQQSFKRSCWVLTFGLLKVALENLMNFWKFSRRDATGSQCELRMGTEEQRAMLNSSPVKATSQSHWQRGPFYDESRHGECFNISWRRTLWGKDFQRYCQGLSWFTAKLWLPNSGESHASTRATQQPMIRMNYKLQLSVQKRISTTSSSSEVKLIHSFMRAEGMVVKLCETFWKRYAFPFP